jgi:hypothetical protein
MKAGDRPATDEEAVSAALRSFMKTNAAKFIAEIAMGLASYDWRTSSTPGLTAQEQLKQSVFRGSSGYRELRKQLLAHLAATRPSLKKDCDFVMNALGYT